MNGIEAQSSPHSQRLRVIHLFCVAIAVLSTFFTAIASITYTPYDGLEITAHAAFTLAFAHAALFLARRAYAPTENRRRFLVFYSLGVGYLCAIHGLYLLLTA
jgi:hypothetical protein